VYDPESPLSASTQALMDDEVRALLDRLHVRTTELLRTHRTALDALAEALLDRETIDGAEVLRLVAAHGVPVTAALTAA
jgi:cell division protease FtsH